MKINRIFLGVVFSLFLVLSISAEAKAELKANEILVVANSFVKQSVSLSKYYMEQREIPSENLLILRTTEKETITSSVYQSSIVKPVKRKLQDDPLIRCVVLMYGIPLRINSEKLNFTEQHTLRYLQAEKKKFEDDIKKDPAKEDTINEKLKRIKNDIDQLKKSNQQSSVDSELALVMADEYQLEGWQPNPMYIGPVARSKLKKKDRVPVMVSRLDGPDEATVMRVIDDSLAVEKKGLWGAAYFDARWPKPPIEKRLSGYALYDNSFHRAAALLRKKMPVALDQESTLFPEGAELPAALYSGWYSLARYVDSFKWIPGSVGYHIASSECATLKKKGSSVWCKMMLEKGVAATLGPVSEPYVQAFPLPELFFGLLTDGKFNLVESYFMSLPFLSWRMVLIGDPLYWPYKNAHQEISSQ